MKIYQKKKKNKNVDKLKNKLINEKKIQKDVEGKYNQGQMILQTQMILQKQTKSDTNDITNTNDITKTNEIRHK